MRQQKHSIFGNPAGCHGGDVAAMQTSGRTHGNRSTFLTTLSQPKVASLQTTRQDTAQPGAFTIAEMVLAMAILALIGLAIAGVAFALTGAYSNSQDYYQCLQTSRITSMRIQADLRKAKLIASASSDSLVLWDGDVNGDGNINLSEIVILDWNSSAKQLWDERVVYPASMDAATKAALDISVPLSTLTDVAGAKTYLRARQYYQCTTLATGVTSMQFAVTPAAPLSVMATGHMTITEGRKSLSMSLSASLRADSTEDVDDDDGVYTLVTDEN